MAKVRPGLCDVCHDRPAATIVVDFIFACDECAAKIEAAIRQLQDRRAR
jgi:hypothetical protein